MIEEDVSLKKRTLSNLLWRLSERMGAQFIAFMVSIILARLLSPEHYGLVALVTVVTSILNVFVDSGLGMSLIQKKDADESDFSTVFYANVVFCVLLYMLLFLCAPLVSRFYHSERLVPVVRTLGLTIVISGVKNVQQAYVSKHLMFRKFFFATLSGTVVAAIVGVAMALFGFGVWALVAQQLINAGIDTCILWLIVPWRPGKSFSVSRLKVLFSFGWKLLAASLLHTIYVDIRQLVIGRVYSPSDLAYYNQGQKFPQFISSNINSSIDSVLFPVMSASQDDMVRVKAMTRRAIMTSSYIMMPLLFALAGASRNIISLVLTDKWQPCAPYMMLACFVFALEPLQTANLNAIKAVGRSDITLKLEIVKKTVSTAIVFASMPFGVMAIAAGGAAYAVIASMLNSFPNKRLLHYSYFEQLRDIVPSFLVASCMAVLIYLLPVSALPLLFRVLVQIVCGMVLYIAVTAVLRFEAYRFLRDSVLSYVRGRQK